MMFVNSQTRYVNGDLLCPYEGLINHAHETWNHMIYVLSFHPWAPPPPFRPYSTSEWRWNSDQNDYGAMGDVSVGDRPGSGGVDCRGSMVAVSEYAAPLFSRIASRRRDSCAHTTERGFLKARKRHRCRLTSQSLMLTAARFS